MRISLEQTENPNEPFVVNVEIVTITIDAGATFRIPVRCDPGAGASRYQAEVCGFVLLAETPQALARYIGDLLQQLIFLARLPSYVFIARRAGGIFPVYTVDSEVLATTPGGPLFRHVELAKVREYLTDYLHETGTLGSRGLSDKLHVRGVDLRTLGLRRPVFYLKKRVPGQNDFWAPVFETADRRRIYTYAADARRQVPIAAGQEVIILRELVAQALLTAGRLRDLYDLRPDRLMPAYWERLRRSLTSEGTITANGLTLPLFSNAYLWLAVEERAEDPVRYSLFAGENADGVARRAAADLARRGMGAPLLAI